MGSLLIEFAHQIAKGMLGCMARELLPGTLQIPRDSTVMKTFLFLMGVHKLKHRYFSWNKCIYIHFFLLIAFMGNCPISGPTSVVACVCLRASNTLSVCSWSCTMNGESGSRGLQLFSKYMITSCNTDL